MPERKTIGHFGPCATCDPGYDVPLMQAVAAGDPVNLCQHCADEWAADIMRGVRERSEQPRAAPFEPLADLPEKEK